MSHVALLLAVSVESLLLALGHLSTGLEYYRNGQQDRAQREFAVVLEDYGGTSAADAALYWSAQSYAASGNQPAATNRLAELAAKFPHSSYLEPAGQVAATRPPAAAAVTPASPPAPVAKAGAGPPAATGPAVAVAIPPPGPASAHAVVYVRKLPEATVVELDGRAFKSTSEFGAALAARKAAAPKLEVKFQRDPDVDLQMVIDVVNTLDSLQIKYRLH